MLLTLTSVVSAAPIITNITPTIGTTNEMVTIRGSGFSPSGQQSVVYFNNGGLFAPSTTVSGGQINVSGVPVGATTGSIMVSNSTGVFLSTDDFIVIGPEPYITSFTPAIGDVGSNVTISGIHFFSGNTPIVTAVLFNTQPVTQASAPIIGQINVVVPPGASSGPITVFTEFGSNTTAANFYLPPSLTNFTPAGGVIGTTVTLRGRNFLGATGVRFQPNLIAVPSFVSDTNLTVAVPAGARTGALVVIAPGGQSLSSSNFVVPPTLLSFSPAAGPITTAVNIRGSNLFAPTSVTFNGTPATISATNANGTNVTAIVPNTTTGPIVVTTADGSVTSAVPFYLPPQITALNPNQGRAGTSVLISGNNLSNATAVTFNGVNAGFSNMSPTLIVAVVPPDTLTGKVAVQTPGGWFTNQTPLFLIQPLITGFTPDAGMPGDLVTISGTNFTASSQVFFNNGTNQAAVNSATLTQIIAVAPTNSPSGAIKVLTDGGSDITTNFFYFGGPPLEIRILGAGARVSWPTNLPGFRLQSATNISTNTAWSDVLGGPAIEGGQFVVTNGTTASNRIFRLSR